MKWNPVNMELAFTPLGRIVVRDQEEDGRDAKESAALKKVAEAFRDCPEKGLFLLAADKLDEQTPASFAFWRDFAQAYLSELCHTPENAALKPILPPEAEQLERTAAAAPLMQGADYVNQDALADVWVALDGWVRGEIKGTKTGLAGFLKRKAPRWRQVGRVCFHLAENKADPDYPFAFLA
ncbi:MAG: hypothetical protein N2C14_13585, partial [Planctomycetales bacterium]